MVICSKERTAECLRFFYKHFFLVFILGLVFFVYVDLIFWYIYFLINDGGEIYCSECQIGERKDGNWVSIHDLLYVPSGKIRSVRISLPLWSTTWLSCRHWATLFAVHLVSKLVLHHILGTLRMFIWLKNSAFRQKTGKSARDLKNTSCSELLQNGVVTLIIFVSQRQKENKSLASFLEKGKQNTEQTSFEP